MTSMRVSSFLRAFIERRFGVRLCRSSCLNYLHRRGFVLKRPKKRLTKADEAKRQAFVARYREVRQKAQTTHLDPTLAFFRGRSGSADSEPSEPRVEPVNQHSPVT